MNVVKNTDSVAWKLDYVVGKLGLIPAFGDTIGKDVNKAELALCATYAKKARESHAALVAVAVAAKHYMETRKFGHGIEDPLWHAAVAALAIADGNAK